MSEFDVTPEDLANASGAVTKPAADLATALKAINNAAALAAGTPVAGAYDGLVSTASTDVATLQTAVDDLAHALKAAAQNYQNAESTNTLGFGRIR